MPRRIIPVSGSGPGQNPDTALASLISALASLSSGTGASTRLAFDKKKFAAEEEEKKGIGLAGEKFLDALKELSGGEFESPSKGFVEKGGLPGLIGDITGGVGTETGVSQTIQDPEVTQRKKAIKDTLPEPLDTLDSLGFQGTGDAPLVQTGRSLDRSTGEFVEDQVLDERVVTPPPIDIDTTGFRGPDRLPIEVPLEKDTGAPPVEEVEVATNLVDNPADAPVFSKGIRLPDEQSAQILQVLETLTPRELRLVQDNPALKSMFDKVLGRKSLARQILEKTIEVASDPKAHLQVIEDDVGGVFLFDFFTKKVVKVDGEEMGKTAVAFGKGMPTSYKEYLLSNYTMDQIAGDTPSDPEVGSKKDFERYGKFLINKDPERANVLATLLKDFESSQAIKEMRKTSLTVRNIFSAGSLDFKVASDEALRTMFLKLLDPPSVVRESEFDRLDVLRNLVGRARAFIERLTSEEGASLTPKDRKAIKLFARHVMINRFLSVSDFAKKYRIAAKEAGVNPDAVVTKKLMRNIKAAEEAAETDSLRRKANTARKKLDSLKGR